MDFSNLKGLLETKESIDLSDNDLEDELNAIISGQAFGVKTKQKASSSTENVKRVKQNDPKLSQNSSKINKKSNDDQNDCKNRFLIN